MHGLKGLGVPAYVFETGDDQKKRLEGLKADFSTKLATLPDGPAKEKLLGEINKIETWLATWLTNTAKEAEGAVILWAAQGEAKIQEIYQKFEHWFETGQERSQEWFTTHARIITGVLAVITAFALQLDTIEIYKLVSSNRAVRDNLVAQTKNVIEQGEKVFKDQNQPAVLQAALSQIRSTNAFLTNVSIHVGDTVGAVRAKIQASATNHSPQEVNKLLANFDEQTLNIVNTNLANYRTEYTNVSTLLDKTGFDLFPKDGGRWQNEGDWTSANRRIWMGHVFGMLFSALLLSLGAPFWFNTLKGLASLRSSVAKNISEEDKAEQKNPKAGQTSKLPPTVT